MNLLVPEKINIKEKISRQEEPRTVPILSNQSSNWFICLPTCMYWVTSICRYFTRYSNDKQDRQEAHILTVFCQKKKKKTSPNIPKSLGPELKSPVCQVTLFLGRWLLGSPVDWRFLRESQDIWILILILSVGHWMASNETPLPLVPPLPPVSASDGVWGFMGLCWRS